MKSLNRPFFILQALAITIQAIAVSFLSTILVRYGFPSSRIGLTFTLAALGCMLSKPLLGALGDRAACSRALTLVLMLFGSGCYVALVFCPDLPPLLLALAVLDYVAICSATAVIDSWSMRLIHDGYEINYGLTRSAGSLFYAIASIIIGQVMEQYGPKPCVPALIILLIALFVTVRFLPDPTLTLRPTDRVSLPNGLSRLSRNRIYCLTLLGFFLAQLSSASGDSFLSVRVITELGGTEADMGRVFFLQAISEVPILILFRTIRRRFHLPLHILLAFSAFVFGFKPLCFGLAHSPTAIVLLSLMNGLSFGIYVTAIVDFVLETVEERYLATGQLVFGAIGQGMGNMVGNLACGVVADRIGAGNMMICFSIFGMLGALIILFGTRRKEKMR